MQSRVCEPCTRHAWDNHLCPGEPFGRVRARVHPHAGSLRHSLACHLLSRRTVGELHAAPGPGMLERMAGTAVLSHALLSHNTSTSSGDIHETTGGVSASGCRDSGGAVEAVAREDSQGMVWRCLDPSHSGPCTRCVCPHSRAKGLCSARRCPLWTGSVCRVWGTQQSKTM